MVFSIYMFLQQTGEKPLERPCGDCTDIVPSLQSCIEIVRRPCGFRKGSARTCAVAVRETYDPLAIFVPKKTRLKSCGCRTITAHPPHGYLAMPVQCFYRLRGLYRLGFFFKYNSELNKTVEAKATTWRGCTRETV